MLPQLSVTNVASPRRTRSLIGAPETPWHRTTASQRMRAKAQGPRPSALIQVQGDIAEIRARLGPARIDMKMLGSLVATSESQMKNVLLDMSLGHVPVSTRLHVAESPRTAVGSHRSAVESRHTIAGSHHAAAESTLIDAGSHLTSEERKAGRQDATLIGKTRNGPHGEERACRLLELSSGIPLPVLSLFPRQKERSTRTMRTLVWRIAWKGPDERMTSVSERSAGTTTALGISETGVSDIAVGSGRESLIF